MRHSAQFMTQLGKRMVRSVGLGVVGIVCLTLVSPAWAEHFVAPISPEHTAYGVSQLLAGPIPGGDRLKEQNDNFLSITLSNPNHVEQLAAVLIYERKDSAQNLGRPEKFLGCFVKKLTPHASYGVGNQQVVRELQFCDRATPGDQCNEVPWYAEVLTIPTKPVLRAGATSYQACPNPIQPDATNCTGAADGLGIIAEAGTSVPLFDESTSENGVIHQGHLQALYPRMFSLPDPFEGRDQASLAAACICEKARVVAADQFIVRAYGSFFDSTLTPVCLEEEPCIAPVHPVCQVGVKLDSAPPANPGCPRCAADVCQRDPYCCNVSWDAKCVAEVAKFCAVGERCTR